MDVRWISIVVALVVGGVGVLMKLSDGQSRMRRVWSVVGSTFILIGATIMGVLVLGMFGIQFRSPIVIETEQDGSVVSSHANNPAQRSLTSGCLAAEEEVNLMKELSASAPHAFYIHYARGDHYAVACAESFRRVFGAVKWVERNYLPEDFSASQRGLSIRVKDAAAPPPGAVVFVSALKKIDIEVPVRTPPVWDTTEHDVFALDVGYTP